MRSLLKLDSAVSAWSRARLVQVDEYFGMPERSSPAIAHRLASMHKPDRLLFKQRLSAQGCRLQRHVRLLEPCIRLWTWSSALSSRPWLLPVWSLRVKAWSLSCYLCREQTSRCNRQDPSAREASRAVANTPKIFIRPDNRQ